MRKLILILVLIIGIRLLLIYLQERPFLKLYRTPGTNGSRRYSLADLESMEW